MGKYCLLFLLIGSAAASTLTFCGVNLFLAAAVFTAALVVLCAAQALCTDIIKAVEHRLNHSLAPAFYLLLNCFLLYFFFCQLGAAAALFWPQFSKLVLSLCVSGAVLLAVLAAAVFSLRALVIKFANR